MRFLAAAFLGIILLAVPATATMASPGPTTPVSASNNSGRVFGTANCTQPLPCPGDSSAPSVSSSTMIASANACVAQFFGYSSPDGLFEDYAGLGSDNCLTTKPNVIPRGMGAQLSPHCCIVKQAAGYCSFHCDMLTQ